MKLSDYVVQYLVDRGVGDIFLASGGGIMHLLDSVGRNSAVRYYCNYHEQACAIAAEGYARSRNHVGVCLVTAGPGAANAVSGIVGAWVDSIPVLVLAGQVRRDLMADFSKMRQLGPQEANTVAMASAVTKYASTVLKPEDVRYELDRAWYEATTGRPGPAWLEFPLDVQGAVIDDATLKQFTGPPRSIDSQSLKSTVAETITSLRQSRRPVLLCGNGVRLDGSHSVLHELLESVAIPVLLPITAKDVLEEDHPMNVGIFGTAGQRRANFALQNADLVVSVGTGLNCQKAGFNFAGFAPNAKKIVVDIDRGQLFEQVIKPDVGVLCGAGEFLREMIQQLGSYTADAKWLDACAKWKEHYPVITDDLRCDPDHVNSYLFMDVLADTLGARDAVVTGNALDCASCFQGFRVKHGQRVIISGWGSMGWDLPLAIGTSVARGEGRTICVTGDGSIQWNIQELLTIKRYHLPIKMFVFDNGGYQSIRATQNTFFEGRFVGADYASGVDTPRLNALAAAYDFGYFRIDTNEELTDGIQRVIDSPGPALCAVNISPSQGISPKASAFRRADGSFESRPLEDMAPFLSREEVIRNMHLFDGD